jgi:2-polyprenyl-6-methoxyphenol hydroxylase-like FAD-dependent oxidoreductase
LLLQTLAGGLEPNLHFGKEAIGYEIDAEGQVHLHFRDGSSTTGDVLVVADGVHSVIRRQLLPNAEVVDTGARCLIGKTFVCGEDSARFQDLLTAAFTIIRGPATRSLFVGPFLRPAGVESPESDYLMWVFAAPREQFAAIEWDGIPAGDGRLREWASKRIDDWHPRCREMVAAADPNSCRLITIRQSAPVAAWEPGPVTVLGDAIHAMIPAGGAGANTALRDAALLCQILTAVSAGEVALTDAIRSYEDEMRGYGFAAVRESARMAEALFGFRFG